LALIAPAGPPAAAAARDPLLRALQRELSDEWWVFPPRRLHGRPVGPIMLHARHGIAVDTADPAGAAGVTRHALHAVGIADYFDGNLPVVAVRLDPAAPQEFRRRLDEAFTAAAPLTIADADWVAWAIDAFADEEMELDATDGEDASPAATDDAKRPLREAPATASDGRLAAAGGTALPPLPVGEPARRPATVFRFAAAMLLLVLVIAGLVAYAGWR
jgi:hypothetical protein